MRRNSSVLLLIALAMGIAMLGSSVSGAASVVLLGDQTVLPAGDSNSAGSAEAFKTTATTSGTVATLSVYVDTGSTATTLIAGLYADAAGKPGALLGSGGLSGPVSSAWNTIAMTSGVPVTSGTAYWIAVLGAERLAEVPRPLLWRWLDDLRQHADDADARCPGRGPAPSRTPTARSPRTRAPLRRRRSSSARRRSRSRRGVGGPDPASKTLGIANSGSGTLSWTAAENATWFGISPSSGNGPATATVAVTTSGLAPGTYNDTITVTATGAQGSPQSIPVQLTLTAPDTQAPTTPAGLTAAASGNTVALSWTASTDNVGVARYDVFRSTTSGFTPSSANKIGQSPSPSYADPSLAAGTYYYAVEAEDAAGNLSDPSRKPPRPSRRRLPSTRSAVTRRSRGTATPTQPAPRRRSS